MRQKIVILVTVNVERKMLHTEEAIRYLKLAGDEGIRSEVLSIEDILSESSFYIT